MKPPAQKKQHRDNPWAALCLLMLCLALEQLIRMIGQPGYLIQCLSAPTFWAFVVAFIGITRRGWQTGSFSSRKPPNIHPQDTTLPRH